MEIKLIEGLVNYGLPGIFIGILTFFLIKLWRAKESSDEYIRTQSTENIKVIEKMSSVIRRLIDKSGNLPRDVKVELDDDFNKIKNGIQDLKNRRL